MQTVLLRKKKKNPLLTSSNVDLMNLLKITTNVSNEKFKPKIKDLKNKFKNSVYKSKKTFGLASHLKKSFLVKSLTIHEKEYDLQNLKSFYDLKWEIYNQNSLNSLMSKQAISINDFLNFYQNNAEILLKPRTILKGHVQAINNLVFTKDMCSLISSSKCLSIIVWDMHKEEEVRIFNKRKKIK